MGERTIEGAVIRIEEKRVHNNFEFGGYIEIAGSSLSGGKYATGRSLW